MAVDKRKQAAFLAAFATCGSIALAAAVAKVSRRSHTNWLQDAAYAQRFNKARTEAGDMLEDEARRRAIEGTRTPILWKGKPCFGWVNRKGELVPEGDPKAVRKVPLFEHRYSDRLLMMLLSATKPKKYAKRCKLKNRSAFPVQIESQEDKFKRLAETINTMRAHKDLQTQ